MYFSQITFLLSHENNWLTSAETQCARIALVCYMLDVFEWIQKDSV